MKDIVENLKMHRFRDSTRKTYWCVWRIFNRFFIRLDYKPVEWEQRILLFVGYLIDNDLKSATVKSYLSTIRAVLWENNITLNEDLFLLSSLTRACKLKNDQVITRLPIHKDLPHLLIRETSKHFGRKLNQPYIETLYKAIFMAAYYGLLRIGEVTQGPHVLLVKNVHVGVNKKKLLFILESSKMHNKGNKPQRIKISSSATDDPRKEGWSSQTAKEFCLYHILSKFVEIRPPVLRLTEQFFVFGDRQPVMPHHLRTTLRTLLNQLGLQAKLYNGHSFPIGRGSDMVKKGSLSRDGKENWSLEIKCSVPVFERLKHLCYPFIHFVDNVEAFFDVWILGDNFTKEAEPVLQAFKRKALAANSSLPYMLQCYNVRVFYAGTGYSGAAQLIHPLVQALNAHHRLPKYIFMLPDKDLITALHDHNINAALVMGSTIHYLIKQIDLLIDRRQHDLEQRNLVHS